MQGGGVGNCFFLRIFLAALGRVFVLCTSPRLNHKPTRPTPLLEAFDAGQICEVVDLLAPPKPRKN